MVMAGMAVAGRVGRMVMAARLVMTSGVLVVRQRLVRRRMASRWASHRQRQLHGRPGDLAQHGRRHRTPNREQHSQQHKEPGTPDLHERKGSG